MGRFDDLKTAPIHGVDRRTFVKLVAVGTGAAGGLEGILRAS
jgi:hypothetical protein